MSIELLEEITAKSIENNKKAGITGMLLGIENRYLQYLEGKEPVVKGLMETIKKDGRHHEINQWLQGHTQERIFSDWSMGSWMLSNEKLKKLSAIKEIEDFLAEQWNEATQSKNLFLKMMQDLIRTWIKHEPERATRLKR